MYQCSTNYVLLVYTMDTWYMPCCENTTT